jgi:hypothetical protein
VGGDRLEGGGAGLRELQRDREEGARGLQPGRAAQQHAGATALRFAQRALPETGGGEGRDRGRPAAAAHFQGDPAAERVAGDVRALDPVALALHMNSPREVRCRRLFAVGQRRRVAEPRHVDRVHLPLGLQQRDHRLPDTAGAAEAVQQQQRLAGGAHVGLSLVTARMRFLYP